MRRCSRRSSETPRSAAGDEDVFAALVVERLPVEATEENLEFESRDIEQPEPFVLGRPPERAGAAFIERDVDPVVADGVADSVRNGVVLMPPVQPGRYPVIEREGIPGKASVRPQ